MSNKLWKKQPLLWAKWRLLLMSLDFLRFKDPSNLTSVSSRSQQYHKLNMNSLNASFNILCYEIHNHFTSVRRIQYENSIIISQFSTRVSKKIINVWKFGQIFLNTKVWNTILRQIFLANSFKTKISKLAIYIHFTVLYCSVTIVVCVNF